MKKYLIILLALICIFSLAATAGIAREKTEEEPPSKTYFEATVRKVSGNYLLVEPLEGTAERQSSDRIQVGTNSIAEEESVGYLPQAQAGDTVRIGYHGEIAESYPAQINSAFEIKLISRAEPASDKIPMVMVDGRLYYDTGKESVLERRCGTMDGEITSAVDGTQIPTEDDQSNFGTGFGYQYVTDSTIEIYMDDKWIVFEHRNGDGSQVCFGNNWYNQADLSEETLEWLAWYNGLTEYNQLAVNHIPSDLLKLAGIAGQEDVAVPEAGDGQSQGNTGHVNE